MGKQVGVQLYSVRENLALDFEATVKQIADAGVPILEGYRNMPLTHQAIAELIKGYGLQMLSCHLPLPFDEFEREVLQAIDIYGLKYVVVPSQPREDFTSADGIKRICERLNRANEILKKHGVLFGYHNHEFEFVPVDGRPAYEIMLEELDESIILEVDTYWAQMGGLNPSELVKRLGKRAPLLHIKDGAADPEKRDQAMVALGEGRVDIESIVAAGGQDTECLIIELDSCATDMLTAVEKSCQYLVQKGFVNGS